MLPLASVLVAVAIGFAGLVVDVRNGYVVRAMLQRAVDDAALSAQRWSAQAGDTPAGGAANAIAGAVAEAMRVVDQELRSENVAGISVTSATLTGGHLTLRSRARVRTFFLPLFGIGFWLPDVRADIALWAPATPASGTSGQGAGSSGGGSTVVEMLGSTGSVPAPPPGGFEPMGPSQIGLWRVGAGLPAGDGSGMAAAAISPAGVAASPDTSASMAAAPPDGVSSAEPCNCDAIAAGDPVTAREALDRMGVTPGNPGPFEGDLTSAMGFGEMQSGADGGGGADGAW